MNIDKKLKDNKVTLLAYFRDRAIEFPSFFSENKKLKEVSLCKVDKKLGRN
jgi:hypothetical protein